MKTKTITDTPSRYTIHRECWNEKTFNGYFDVPFWYIKYNGYEIGLTDTGKMWSVINGVDLPISVREAVILICQQCKINIPLNQSKDTDVSVHFALWLQTKAEYRGDNTWLIISENEIYSTEDAFNYYLHGQD